LVADTITSPDTAEVLQLVEMVFEFCPDTMETPAGTVQLKVTPGWYVVVYINPGEAAHTGACPLTTGGTGMLFRFTDNTAFDVPQLLVTATDTLPGTAEEDQEVAIDEEPCPDVMITPAGTVHE